MLEHNEPDPVRYEPLLRLPLGLSPSSRHRSLLVCLPEGHIALHEHVCWLVF